MAIHNTVGILYCIYHPAYIIHYKLYTKLYNSIHCNTILYYTILYILYNIHTHIHTYIKQYSPTNWFYIGSQLISHLKSCLTIPKSNKTRFQIYATITATPFHNALLSTISTISDGFWWIRTLSANAKFHHMIGHCPPMQNSTIRI